MQKTLLTIAFLTPVISPASADTPFWFTCDFVQESGETPISFGMHAESGDGQLVVGTDGDLRPVRWYEMGGVTHLFYDDTPRAEWILSFDPEAGEALTYAEAHVTVSTSCRFGGE